MGSAVIPAIRISSAALLKLYFYSDSDYGSKKKKKGGAKKGGFKPKKTFFGAARGKRKIKRQDSDESDYDEKPKKRSKKATAEISSRNIVPTAGRRTRGVKINYSLIQGSSGSEVDTEAAKGKGKGPRKWDGSEDEFKPEDKSEEEKPSEEEEDEVPSEDLDSAEERPKKVAQKKRVSSEVSDEESEEEERPKKVTTKKKVSSEVSDEESEEEDNPKASKTPDISDESEEEVPNEKPILKPPTEAPKPMLLSKASPFPKAPPPGDESDSDDGFQSPATPSEDEDED